MAEVIYIGPFGFPDGGAAARRILGVAKSMQAAGFEVKIASGQMGKAGQLSQWFEGIEFFSLNERTAEHLPRLLKHFSYVTMGQKTVHWLDSLTLKPHTLVLYSGYTPYLFQLIPWARRHRVRLIFDAVEWYDPASPWGWLSPYQLNIELAMRFLVPRAGGVIAISDYLHRYYKGRGCRSVLVPPTLDVSAVPARIQGPDIERSLELVYAGTPAQKDLLNNILEAVLRLRRAGHKLHMSVAGVKACEAEAYPAVRSRQPDEVSAALDFRGILSHNAALDLVRHADFSLILRHDARYSRAGFPTKFVESMTVGTPVIGNLTSDLHRFLVNGDTGFTCAGPTPEDLQVALKSALAMSHEQHVAMRRRCRNVAAKYFDYRVFVEPLSTFLQSKKT